MGKRPSKPRYRPYSVGTTALTGMLISSPHAGKKVADADVTDLDRRRRKPRDLHFMRSQGSGSA
jgi:hypothetical protein